MEAFFNKAMDVFCKRFGAVSDISEATDFFTTAEIADAIIDIYPIAEIEYSELIEFLENKNYTYINEPGKLSLHLKWMVKRTS